MILRTLLSLTCLIPALSFADTSNNAALVNTAEKVKALDKQDEAILERHYPFYFVYGRPLSKLQLSVKVPIVRKVPFYFGYSQVMFWALEENSKPFRDQTYNPELFYRYKRDFGALKSIDFSPWSHNSNGKRDADSRSYNRAYLRFNFDQEFPRWIVRGSVQGSYLNNFDPTNRDILDYIGPLSFSSTTTVMRKRC